MSESETYPTGGCMCGDIRYELLGEPIAVIYCHCGSCRRQTGAPTASLAGMRRDDVRFSQGERAIYSSSPGVGRGFCRKCGTTLTWEGDGEKLGPLIEIHTGTLDDPSTLVPETHIHCDERLPHFDVADELPRHRELDEGKPYRFGPG